MGAMNEELRRHLPAKTWCSCASPGNNGDLILLVRHMNEIRKGKGSPIVEFGALEEAWWNQAYLDSIVESEGFEQGNFDSIWMGRVDGMIWVDRFGHRIVNEKDPYHTRAQKCHIKPTGSSTTTDRLVTFIIGDTTAQKQYGCDMYGSFPTGKKMKSFGSTTVELTEQLRAKLAGMKDRNEFNLSDDFAKNLETSIERFNRFAADGNDLDFKRGQRM